MTNYRDELFEHYDVHARAMDVDDGAKLRWLRGYARQNYLSHLARLMPAEANLLEIGCSKGYLLAAFHGMGFQHLNGIDLSPSDVETARRLAPDAVIECTNA